MIVQCKNGNKAEEQRHRGNNVPDIVIVIKIKNKTLRVFNAGASCRELPVSHCREVEIQGANPRHHRQEPAKYCDRVRILSMYELHKDVISEVSEQVDEEDSKEEGGKVARLNDHAHYRGSEVQGYYQDEKHKAVHVKWLRAAQEISPKKVRDPGENSTIKRNHPHVVHM